MVSDGSGDEVMDVPCPLRVDLGTGRRERMQAMIEPLRDEVETDMEA